MVSLKFTSCIPLQLPPTFHLSLYSDGKSKVYTVYTTTIFRLQHSVYILSLYSDGESKVYIVYTTTTSSNIPPITVQWW